MIRLVLPLLFLASPVLAADLVPCQTSVRGERIEFFYDPESPSLKESLSLRERLLGGKGEITCPGLVTLRALTPELSDADRAPFCLQWDKGNGTYLGYDLGPRDAWLTCRTAGKSFCERVNRSKEAAGRWGAAVSGLAVDAGVETAMHAAGVISVQGPAATIGQSLVGLGATAVQGVGAGAAIGAVAVTAVAVGGAIYVCSDSGAEAAAVMPVPERKLQPGEVPPGSALPEGTPPGPPLPPVTAAEP
jgi:hypothetical protein